MPTIPGTLLHHETIPTNVPGARAWRVRYASSDVNGKPTESTGLVIAPIAEGIDRFVLTWAHGTTGLGDAACPSSQPDPARELTVYFSPESTQSIDYGVPGLQGFIDAGWVVCATDYQGLGTPGMHQYMVSRTNAKDAINIVHAARELNIGAGTTVGCMGWSQGGGTAAAVAELDSTDYKDLTLVGTVPMSPGVAIISLQHPTGLAATLAGNSGPPDGHLVMTFAGYSAADETLKLSDILNPLGVSIIEGAYNTQPVHHLSDTVSRLYRLKGSILQINSDAMPAWKAAFTAGSATLKKPVCPVFVCMDTFDGGTVIPVEWQEAYVADITALGATVTTKSYPNDDHFSLPTSCVADARQWLTSLL